MDDLAKILPQPERQLLGSRREYLAAFDELVAGLRHELRVFDPDCAAARAERARRASRRCARFLLASRDNRLLIAVHDPEHLRRHAPRFLALLARVQRSDRDPPDRGRGSARAGLLRARRHRALRAPAGGGGVARRVRVERIPGRAPVPRALRGDLAQLLSGRVGDIARLRFHDASSSRRSDHGYRRSSQPNPPA